MNQIMIHPEYNGPLVIESYLKKRKNKKTTLFSPFTKRWFILNLNQGTFSYYKGKNTAKASRVIMLKDIIRVHPQSNIQMKTKDWVFDFMVEAKDRVFVLIAETKPIHDLWVQGFSAVLVKEAESDNPGENPSPMNGNQNATPMSVKSTKDENNANFEIVSRNSLGVSHNENVENLEEEKVSKNEERSSEKVNDENKKKVTRIEFDASKQNNFAPTTTVIPVRIQKTENASSTKTVQQTNPVVTKKTVHMNAIIDDQGDDVEEVKEEKPKKESVKSKKEDDSYSEFGKQASLIKTLNEKPLHNNSDVPSTYTNFINDVKKKAVEEGENTPKVKSCLTNAKKNTKGMYDIINDMVDMTPDKPSTTNWASSKKQTKTKEIVIPPATVKKTEEKPTNNYEEDWDQDHNVSEKKHHPKTRGNDNKTEGKKADDFEYDWDEDNNHNNNNNPAPIVQIKLTENKKVIDEPIEEWD